MKLLYVVSTKKDGNLSQKWENTEDVIQAQERFLQKHGLRHEDVVIIDTEHGERITHVTAKDKGTAIETEALITSEPNIGLFLLTADCFPLAYHDPVRGVIAIAHLGWRPVGLQLARKVIEEMMRVYGSNPKDVIVFIGPGIQKESYMLDTLEQGDPAWKPFIALLPDGRYQVDLRGYITKQLLDAGVLETNLRIDPTDTATSDHYFSHYRSVRTNEPEGRFASVIARI